MRHFYSCGCSWGSSTAYLQLVQSEVAQPAVELCVVASLGGLLQDSRAEGQALEVVILRHLVLLQVVVDRGEPVVRRALVCSDT